MTELDKLIAQRKEIDKRIRELKDASYKFGRVKAEFDANYRHHCSMWKLSIKVDDPTATSTQCKLAMVRESKEDLIAGMELLMTDIINVKNQLESEFTNYGSL